MSNKKSSPIGNEKTDNTICEQNCGSLTSNNIKSIIGTSSDIVFMTIYIGENKSLPLTIIYVDGLINQKILNDDILKPLIHDFNICKSTTNIEVIDLIEKGQIYCTLRKKTSTLNECIFEIINAQVALVFDSECTAITFDIKMFYKRAVTEPTGENVVKGSKDSFVETLRVNTATIRRKIKTPNLIIEEKIVGKQTLTSIGIVFIEGITNKNIVNELKKRIDNIEIDGVLSVGFVEEYIIDNKYSVFPQILFTERTDKFCSNILEGKVGIVIDGMPIGYILPAVFNQYLHAPEDYAQNFWVSSCIRLMRYFLILVTLFLPGFYISVTTFHHEMIPTELAISIEASKEGVPFPSFIEVIFMLIASEILLESGLRFPKTIGHTMSIVGALVVGEAAVSAKLVSPAVVVVMALTTICSFTIPNQDFNDALRLWRFIMVILSSIIGLFGLSMGALILLFHLSKLETFGVPYLSPYVSSDSPQLEDSFIRMPLSFFKKRPSYLKTPNSKRQK